MRMHKIDREIMNIDAAISRNIASISEDRALMSINILSQLRNLVEHVSLKIYANGQDIDVDYDNIQSANAYISGQGKYRFLHKFHRLLLISQSHYTVDGDSSERLMLKYYEYILRIKNLLEEDYGIDVLHNLSDFPLNIDTSLNEYHQKIADRINEADEGAYGEGVSERYYIHKVRPFFIGRKIYYEVTFVYANDKSSKFNHVIAFTSLDISHNYAVRLKLVNGTINVLGRNMPIKIITGWEVSIRPCEINNFAKIFGYSFNVQTVNLEYKNLMKYLKHSNLNLLELSELSDANYALARKTIANEVKEIKILKVLDEARGFSVGSMPGSNVVRYLLFKMNNKIIKLQHEMGECGLLSGLRLKVQCKPFDTIPMNTSLVGHNPRITDILEAIRVTGREDELLARRIRNNTEQKGKLYTKISEIGDDRDDILRLINSYNGKIYSGHPHRKILIYNEYVYIKSYEDNTLDIVNRLNDFAKSGIDGYAESVKQWLDESAYIIDSPEKKEGLTNLFQHSKVALIYGAAGTGKSTMIEHISTYFGSKSKLYLAQTNPAVDNLKMKVKAQSCNFSTIAKHLWSQDTTEYDLLVIDECSTVSNEDMVKILSKTKFRLLVLVGDIYQIESILFGNWFSAIQSLIPEESIFELTEPYRANNQQLLRLWEKVRNIDENILEHIARHNYSNVLDESVFSQSSEDEIILALNYDGLYGINNINRFLQSSNSNPAVEWGVSTYKIGDPVLFNELDRFKPAIYNNLKGRLVNIVKYKDKIQFDVKVDAPISEFDVEWLDLVWLGDSTVRFDVYKHRSTDDDDDSVNTIVPFQVAYAVSIHKAQGLEYGSVKIVITDENDGYVNHSILYTAITRAKERLRLYWSPETEKKILDSLEYKVNKRDIGIMSAKFGLSS